MYEQSAQKEFLTVGAGDAPGGDGCVHGASNVETVEGQVGRQHSFGPNIEGAIYAAAQYGHLPSPFFRRGTSWPTQGPAGLEGTRGPGLLFLAALGCSCPMMLD